MQFGNQVSHGDMESISFDKQGGENVEVPKASRNKNPLARADKSLTNIEIDNMWKRANGSHAPIPDIPELKLEQEIKMLRIEEEKSRPKTERYIRNKLDSASKRLPNKDPIY